MRLPILSGVLALSLFSGTALAMTVIKTGPGVKLLAHNGQEVAGDTLHVEAGQQQVLVSYRTDLSKKVDQSDIHSSDTWVLTFPARDSAISIHAPVVRNLVQFRSFNKHGRWKVLNSTGHEVSFEKYRLKKEGFQFTRNYIRELTEFNKSAHPAALNTLTEEKNYKPGSVDVESNRVDGSTVPMAEKMLRYWYRNADQDTKARFIEWLNSQP